MLKNQRGGFFLSPKNVPCGTVGKVFGLGPDRHGFKWGEAIGRAHVLYTESPRLKSLT